MNQEKTHCKLCGEQISSLAAFCKWCGESQRDVDPAKVIRCLGEAYHLYTFLSRVKKNRKHTKYVVIPVFCPACGADIIPSLN